MDSTTGTMNLMFTIEIDLTDNFDSARTQIFYNGEAVKTYERAEPKSLLADSIRYMMAERVAELVVNFQGGKFLWRPGAYQLTLDAFKFLACLARENLSVSSILDVGCGSGVIGVGLALLTSPRRLQLLDVNPGVLLNAEANAAQLGPGIKVDYRHAVFSERARERFDVIVSNPPYFPTSGIASPSGRLTMTDELDLIGALTRAFGARTSKMYFTFSEVLGSEVRRAIREAGAESSFEVIDGWDAPIPRHIVADELSDRFETIAGNDLELRHRVSVARLSR